MGKKDFKTTSGQTRDVAYQHTELESVASEHVEGRPQSDVHGGVHDIKYAAGGTAIEDVLPAAAWPACARLHKNGGPLSYSQIEDPPSDEHGEGGNADNIKRTSTRDIFEQRAPPGSSASVYFEQLTPAMPKGTTSQGPLNIEALFAYCTHAF